MHRIARHHANHDDAIYADVLSHLESARRQLEPDQLAGPGGTCVENYEQWLDERMLDMALEELVNLGTRYGPPEDGVREIEATFAS